MRDQASTSIRLYRSLARRRYCSSSALQLSERDPVSSRVAEEVCRLASIGSLATEYNLKPIGTARHQPLFVPPPSEAQGRALLQLRRSCLAGLKGCGWRNFSPGGCFAGAKVGSEIEIAQA